MALCVGAGSLVITTREGKPVRAAEAAVEEPVGGLRTWQGTQVSWSEAQKFRTNQSGLSVSSATSQDLPDYVKKSGNDYGYRKLSAKERKLMTVCMHQHWRLWQANKILQPAAMESIMD